MRDPALKVTRTVIFYIAMGIIAILAIPASVFVVAIILIWKVTDKILKKLEE